VAGTFAYAPAAGAVLGAGTQTLDVTFTPTDSTDYTSATASVQLVVNQATPTITWATPAAITYGTALSAGQLDATASVAGTFAYAPAAGAVLGAGTQTLNVTFTPTDTTDYTTATDSVSLTVNPEQSTTTLTSSANPSVYGQSITLTATVTAAYGTLTGSVIFMDGTTALGSASLSGGVATFSTSLTTVGTSKLTAVYSGDPDVDGSSSAVLSQTVNKAASQVALSSSSATSVYGQTVTFTATVSAASPGSGTPIGTVTFYNGAAELGTATLSGGVAKFSTSALAVGSHTIKATYSGDGNFTTSSKSITQTVKKDSTAVTASLGISSVTVTVKPVSPGSGTPTGTVTVKDATTGQTLGTAPLVDGTVTLTDLTLTPKHKITVSYGGDSDDLTSSTTLTVA